MRLPAALLLPLAVTALACDVEDRAVLEAATLTVDPCDDLDPATFAPFLQEYGFISSFRMEQAKPWTLEMRRGRRPSTDSDAVVLQFPDAGAVLQALDASSDRTVALDGKMARLTLILNQTCPDATQEMVGANGTLRLDEFDPTAALVGEATFDLVDGRTPGAPPLATGMHLEFRVSVRDSYPYQPFTE